MLASEPVPTCLLWTNAGGPAVLAVPEVTVKKLVVGVALAAVGFALWRKFEANKAEESVWAKATDSVS